MHCSIVFSVSMSRICEYFVPSAAARELMTFDSDPSQLKCVRQRTLTRCTEPRHRLGVWKGDIELKHLRLKKEALDKFRLVR